MKKPALYLLAISFLIASACSTISGSKDNHESVMLTYFVKDEGEFVFCIAAPWMNPYPEFAEPGYLDFQEDDHYIIVYKYYDPIVLGRKRGLARLNLVITIKQLQNYSKSSPLLVQDLWEEHMLPMEEGLDFDRRANRGIEKYESGQWLRMKLLSNAASNPKPGWLLEPGMVFGTVLWGRYLFSVIMHHQGKIEEADAYIEERFWIIEKVLNSLTVGKNKDEDVSVNCADI